MADFSLLSTTMNNVRASGSGAEPEDAFGFGGASESEEDDDPIIAKFIAAGLPTKYAELAAAACTAHYEPIIQALEENVARLSKVRFVLCSYY